MMFSSITTTVVIYFFVIFSIGLIASFSLKNVADYLLADRRLSGPLVALGVGASDMSGWLMMSVPGLFLLHGINQVWMPLALLLGGYLNWRLVARRLRFETYRLGNALTIPTYLERRFSETTPTLKIVASIVMGFFFTIYVTAGFVSTAVVMQMVLPIDYPVALFVSLLVVLSYTFLGGFFSVNWVDFFQGIWILICLWLVPITALSLLTEVDITTSSMWQDDSYFQPFQGLSTIGILSLLGWGLGYFGQPHILMRFMAISDKEALTGARRIAITWSALAMGGAIFTGVAGRIWLKGADLTNPETIFLVLSRDLFSPWLAGFVLASVLSAIMSTATAQLLAGASVLVEDIYHQTFNSSVQDKTLLLFSRLGVFLLALVSVLLALIFEQPVFSWISLAWSGLGATLGPVIVLSLYWKKMTGNGAKLGIVAAFMVWSFWLVGRYCQWHYVFDLYEILPAFFINLVVIIVLSRKHGKT